MLLRPLLLCLAATGLTGCHTYIPMPVDLDEHLRTFGRRTPPLAIAAGLTRAQGRQVAKMFHPDARLARLRAGVATAKRDHAGAWTDPSLQSNLQRILEAVPYKWVATVHIGFTVPINGRLQKQRDLANRQRDQALVAAWATEQDVANELDRAWIAWSMAKQQAALLGTTCDMLKQLEAVANAFVEVGSLSKPGARVFTLELGQRKAALSMAQANSEAGRLEVLRRLGLHPDAQILLQEEQHVEIFVPEASARRLGLASSPRLLARQLEHATAEANLHLQIRKQWPDLQLLPGWQEEDGEPRASFSFNVPLPIFTGNDPAIALATATRELTAQALRAGLEQLLQELAIAEVRHAAAIDQAHQFSELLIVANQQVEDSRNLASAGQLDPLLMLDALLRVHNVQMQTIKANQTASLASIAINTLLTDPESEAPAKGAGEPR